MEIVRCSECGQDVHVLRRGLYGRVYFQDHDDGTGKNKVCKVWGWRTREEKEVPIAEPVGIIVQSLERRVNILHELVAGLEVQLFELSCFLSDTNSKFHLLEGIVQAQAMSITSLRTLVDTYYQYLMELREEVGKRGRP